MKKLIAILVILAGIVLVSATRIHTNRSATYRTATDSLADERDKIVAHLLDSLKEKKSSPADSVFSNLQVFKGEERLKVSHLLAVMNYWGSALGVSCNYCHSAEGWSSDALKTKRIAREMYNLRQTINSHILKIPDIDPKLAQTNCTTCHDGKIQVRK